ncbi:MAG: response regulator transcription factor [Butyribacter sp.]|nr:response regulator transcription factor [bacterium]MDY3853658.1 response regulator transcription factor [Butyribacter sp.]
MTKDMLLWDDDICWEESLRKELLQDGVRIKEIDTAEALCTCFKIKQAYSAVVLSAEHWNVHMAEIKQLCKESGTPVFLLSSQENTEEEIAAFENGVCDYFLRTTDISVIAARIRARCFGLSGHTEKTEEEIKEDRKNSCLTIGTRQIFLTEMEFEVFHMLLQNQNQLVLRETIYEKVWQEKQTKDMRVVDYVVKRLRQKLKITQFVILSQYKLGYLLQKEK